MKHYKDANNNIFGYMPYQTVPAGLTEISMEDVAAINAEKAPPPTEDEIRSKSMLVGADYNGYQVSFTSNDGNGMLQVKAGFELGLQTTVIHFENGTKMPITAAEFPVFSAWFVQQRNGYFV